MEPQDGPRSLTDSQKRDPEAELVRRMKEEEITGKDLTSFEKMAVIRFLKYEGWKVGAVARLMGVTRKTVWKYKQRDKAALQRRITDLDVLTFAGEHIEMAERLVQKLLAKGQERAAWNVRRGLLSDLQGLGFIMKKPTEVAITGPGANPYGPMNVQELEGEGNDIQGIDKAIEAEFQEAQRDLIPASPGDGPGEDA